MWAESPEQYRDFLKDIAPPIRTLVSERSPEMQEAFWEAVLKGAKGFAGQDGSITMPAITILAAGSK